MPVAVLVALGGAAGGLLRFSLHGGRLTTLAVNVAGSFLLGVLVARRPVTHWSRPLLGTGFLGGFTTMSALAVQAVDSSYVAGTLLVAASVLLGLAAAAAGLRVAR